MRPFRALLVLLAVAMLGALGWHALADDPGYLLLTFGGWSIETTLVVAVLGLLLAGLLLGLLLSLLRAPWRLWSRRRRSLARERMSRGLLALHEGRHPQAQRLLTQAAADRQLRVPALLHASRAAFERGDRGGAEALLEQASRAGGELDAALLAVERLLQHGRADAACEMLDRIGRARTLPPRALELQAEALTRCGRTAEAVALLPALRRSKSRDGTRLGQHEVIVLQAHLAESGNRDELGTRWRALDREQRLRPELVAAYAGRMLHFGDGETAADAIERALSRQWSEQLARLYGKLPQNESRALKTAESWLVEHPDDPGVLLCLGRLCRRQQLWGKAEAYLGQALSMGADSEAWEALAEVFADQGDEPRARQAYANALLAARGESVRPVLRLPQAVAERADAEERGSMGLPRLPAN